MQAETKKYTEEELVDLLRQRSREGFNYLYEHYSGALNASILNFIPDQDQASDLLQEVFVKIWKQIERYDAEKGRLYTWMLQIARNSCLDVVRSTKYKVQQQIQEIPEAVYETGESGFNPDSIGLRNSLQALKTEYRELIELSYFKGYTQDEMSEILQIPLGTIKTRMRSALIQLRKIYKA